MAAPEFNVWMDGAWYGPSYPEAGTPPQEGAELEASETGDAAEVTPGQADVAVEPPPKAGAGSSRSKWVDYAAVHNVAVADDDTRDDIIDALAAVGVRTD